MKNQVVENIIQHHLVSFQQADIDAVMSDYSENAQLITPEHEFKGREEIRGFITELSKHFPTGQSEINLEKLTTVDQLGFIVWNAKTPSVDVHSASDTFVIEDGKISYQTFAGDLTWH